MNRTSTNTMLAHCAPASLRNPKSRSLSRTAKLLGSALLLASAVQAQTAYNWTSPTNGSWGTSTNWTTTGVPGGNIGDTAIFNTASTGSTITLDGNRSLTSLTFGSANAAWTLNSGTPTSSALTVPVGASRLVVNSTTLNLNTAIGSGSTTDDFGVTGNGGTVNFTAALGRVALGTAGTSGAVAMTYNLNTANIVTHRLYTGFNNTASLVPVNSVAGTTVNVNASQTSSQDAITAGGSASGTAGVLVIRNGSTWTQNGNNFGIGFSNAAGASLRSHGRVEVGVVGDSTGNLTIAGGGNLTIANRAGTGILNINNGTLNAQAFSTNPAAFITLASSGSTTTNGATGTLNLKAAGTLITARNFVTAGSGAGTFNFNGGLLRINRATGNVTTDLFGTGITVNVQNGGARIDTQANSTIINRALVGVGTGGLEKLGAGTLTLNGLNTFRGDTTISAGSFTLGDTGSLSFFLGNGVSNRVTGTGTANIEGTFRIDFSSASGTSWNLVASSVAASYVGFNGLVDVSGTETFLNSGGGLWTSTNYVYNQITGNLSSAIPEPSSFAAFGGLAGLALASTRRRRRS